MRTMPGLRIVETQQQREYRGLARARRTDQRDPLARAHGQREVRRARACRDATDSGTRRARRRPRPRDGDRHGHGMRGCANLGLDREQLEQPLRGAGRALQVADHFADRAHGASDDHRVEHERRQLARRKTSGDDVLAADPQDDAHRAEHQQDDRGDKQRALVNAPPRRRECGFDTLAETSPVVDPRGHTPARCAPRAAIRRRRRRRRPPDPGSRVPACARDGRTG